MPWGREREASRVNTLRHVHLDIWVVHRDRRLLHAFHPRRRKVGELAWLMASLTAPTAPWIAILCYSVWFQSWNARKTPAFLSPWERKGSMPATPVKPPRFPKALLSGLLIMAAGSYLISTSLHERVDRTDVYTLAGLYGVGVSELAWGLFFIWSWWLRRAMRNNQVRTNWNRQTPLHDETLITIDARKLVWETSQERNEILWTGFRGIVETAKLFLLYRDAVAYQIIPKHAFGSVELIDAFRHMATTLAGKQPSAFAVLPAANATTA